MWAPERDVGPLGDAGPLGDVCPRVTTKRRGPVLGSTLGTRSFRFRPRRAGELISLGISNWMIVNPVGLSLIRIIVNPVAAGALPLLSDSGL